MDDTTTKSETTKSEVAETVSKPEIGPTMGWVEGGTHSSTYTKLLQQSRADINERQQACREDVAEATNEEVGKIGSTHAHSFSGFNPSKRPCCHVKLVNSKKEVEQEQLVDVILDDATGQRMLIFVCPDCVANGVHQANAQMVVRDANRSWHIDDRTAGSTFWVENAFGVREYHISAGDIMDTDTLKCGNPFCRFRCKIHKNLMYRV